VPALLIAIAILEHFKALDPSVYVFRLLPAASGALFGVIIRKRGKHGFTSAPGSDILLAR